MGEIERNEEISSQRQPGIGGPLTPQPRENFGVASAPGRHESPAAPAVLAGWQYASFGRRWWAYLVDAVILGIVDGGMRDAVSAIDLAGWQDVVVYMLSTMIPLIYFAAFFSTRGQTLGMQAQKIKVVSMDGQPMNWRKGLLRTVGYALSALPLDLGFLWALWDKDKQTWHDKLAGTIVVDQAVTLEQIRGLGLSQKMRASQRRWALGLGIATLACLAGAAAFAATVLTRLVPGLMTNGSQACGTIIQPAAAIFVMNADSSGLTPLTDNPADDQLPVWSPDGRRIATVMWGTLIAQRPLSRNRLAYLIGERLWASTAVIYHNELSTGSV